LYFKDQLARLESMADETGNSVARLVREAIDTFLCEKRTAGT
jgi:predicted DNA-binding protein